MVLQELAKLGDLGLLVRHWPRLLHLPDGLHLALSMDKVQLNTPLSVAAMVQVLYNIVEDN